MIAGGTAGGFFTEDFLLRLISSGADGASDPGEVFALEGSDRPIVSFTAPSVTSPASMHLILTTTDRGDPPLTRYGRVVVTVEPAKR